MGYLYFTTHTGIAKIPKYYYKKTPNRAWVLGTRSEDFSNLTLIKSILEKYYRGGVIMFVDHPYMREKKGQINDSLRTLQFLVTFVDANEGYYLTTLDDLFKKLGESRYIWVNGKKLIVERDVDCGLTLHYNDVRGQIRLGDYVMMYYRDNKTVLPSLRKGEYPIEPCDGYPVLEIENKYVVVKNAVFDMKSKRIILILHSPVNVTTTLVINNLEPHSQYIMLMSREKFRVSADECGLAKVDVKLVGGVDVKIVFKEVGG